MFYQTIGCNGCLIFIILLFLMTIFFKYWHIILLCIVIAYLLNKYNIGGKIQNGVERQQEFKVKTGKVYKQCKVCATKVDRTATICPKCKTPFEG